MSQALHPMLNVAVKAARTAGAQKPQVLSQPDAGQRLPSLIGAVTIPQFLKKA